MSSRPSQWRRWAGIQFALILLAASLPCAAQRTYAVLSLVGDRIDIVDRGAVVGSALDQNRKQSLAVPDAAIDRAILVGADQALKKADPASKPVLMLVNDPALFKAQDAMMESGAPATALIEPLRPMLSQANATHLVIFTKYRHQARFPIDNYEVGNGMIEGAGLYVDQTLWTRKYGTNERARGFLGPYVYFQVTLIELATSTVLANETLLGSTSRSAARGDSGAPWDAMTDEQKVKALVSIARREAFAGTGKVVAALRDDR